MWPSVSTSGARARGGRGEFRLDGAAISLLIYFILILILILTVYFRCCCCFHINWENNPSVCDGEFSSNATASGNIEVQSGEDKDVIGSGTGCAGELNVGAGAKEVTIYETDGTTVFHKLICRFNLID